MKTKFNNISGMLIPNIANAYYQVYHVSFYGKKKSNYLVFTAVITFPEDKSIDSKYSKWMKDPNSPYNVSFYNGDTIEIMVEPNGCWEKVESEEYKQMIKKGEYSFKLQWKCSWWPHSTYLNVTITKHSGINAYIYASAFSTFVAFVHSFKLFADDQVVVLIFQISYTFHIVYMVIHYNQNGLINKIIYNILTLLNIWFFEILEISEHFQVQWPLVLFDASLCIYLFVMVAS
jgi:hypothetical protein